MGEKIMIAVVIVGLAILPAACATKKSLKKEVTRIDQEVSEITSNLEENQTRLKEHDARLAEQSQQLSSLSTESQEALQRAQSAEKLAQGKLIYEVTLTDDSVKFASGRAQVSPKMKEILDNLISQLKTDNKNVYIEIQGFTDSMGSKEYNYRLGLQRAEEVRRYLSEAGIPLHRISTISYGEEHPVANNGTRSGRNKNRRVVVQVLA